MSDEAKATQEIAKTAGKAIDAASKAGSFIARFVSGPLEQGVGIWEDRLRYVRWERQVRLMRRAEDFLKEADLDEPTRAIPLKNALPLLQAATIEEDDQLQDTWAALLVNAGNADGPDVQRVHIEILAQLGSLEAQILERIYALPYGEIQHNGAYTTDLPRAAEPVPPGSVLQDEPSEAIRIALGNLARLGCLRLSTTWGGGEQFNRVLPTVLGRSFVAACTLKRI